CNYLWGGDVHKIPGEEVIINRADHCTPDLEDCCHPGPACIEEPCIKTRVEVCRYFFNHIERKRALASCQQFKQLRDKFPSPRRFFNRLDRSPDPDKGFFRDLFYSG